LKIVLFFYFCLETQFFNLEGYFLFSSKSRLLYGFHIHVWDISLSCYTRSLSCALPQTRNAFYDIGYIKTFYEPRQAGKPISERGVFFFFRQALVVQFN